MKKQVVIPTLVRLTALIFFFNGLFAFIRTILSPIQGEFFLDPRIINIFVALGLAANKRTWYMIGIVSTGANLGLHCFRLAEFTSVGTWAVFYFLLAIVIDVFQLGTLLQKDIRTLYLTPKD